jgi:hypothetical protein
LGRMRWRVSLLTSCRRRDPKCGPEPGLWDTIRSVRRERIRLRQQGIGSPPFPSTVVSAWCGAAPSRSGRSRKSRGELRPERQYRGRHWLRRPTRNSASGSPGTFFPAGASTGLDEGNLHGEITGSITPNAAAPEPSSLVPLAIALACLAFRLARARVHEAEGSAASLRPARQAGSAQAALRGAHQKRNLASAALRTRSVVREFSKPRELLKRPDLFWVRAASPRPPPARSHRFPRDI